MFLKGCQHILMQAPDKIVFDIFYIAPKIDITVRGPDVQQDYHELMQQRLNDWDKELREDEESLPAYEI